MLEIIHRDILRKIIRRDIIRRITPLAMGDILLRTIPSITRTIILTSIRASTRPICHTDTTTIHTIMGTALTSRVEFLAKN
jgi:hypothetical protein